MASKLPSWKTDFPIQKREATYVSRAEFLKVITLFSGLMAFANVLIPLWNFFHRRAPIRDHFVCAEDALPIGAQKTFYIDGDKRNPYMLIRMAAHTWRAYAQKCTHLSCAVVYQHAQGVIACPCHRGFFDPQNGKVLEGPPPRPLAQLPVKVRDGKIFVCA